MTTGSSGTVPNGVGPSEKETLPVGVPDPGGLAAATAVKTTACPTQDGLGCDVAVSATERETFPETVTGALPVTVTPPRSTSVTVMV